MSGEGFSGWGIEPALLNSERLEFIMPGAADGAEAADFFRRNRAYMKCAWGDRGEEYYTAGYQAYKAESDRAVFNYKTGARFFLRLRGGGGIMGLIAFHDINVCLARLAYAVDEAEAGKGYITEAVLHGVHKIAFGVMGLHRVETGIMPRNHASRRVAVKAGFEYEGLLREYLKINGVWENHEMWSVINHE